MTSFDRLFVWDDPALATGLGWYRAVATNRRPAKYRIAATIPAEIDADAPEDALWSELDRLMSSFLARWRAIRDGDALGQRARGLTLLDLCAVLARRMLTHCNFCRWNCRVDRARGAKIGACKLAATTRVSSAFHHRGEELIYRGVGGSGTIFFTSCNMRCAFCQNGDISTDKDNGDAIDSRLLATLAWQLRAEGCHNVNWVGGEVTIHLHAILDAIALLGRGFVPTRVDLDAALPMRADRLSWHELVPEAASFEGSVNAPMLWNSNFFMTDETMRLLRIVTDVWLPDLKFGPGRCAMALAKTPWYWETVTRNLALIRDWGENATIRHLVMPGHVECCTHAVIDWIARCWPAVPVNLMDQYRPDNFCDPASDKYRPEYAAIGRYPRGDEVAAAYSYAAGCGVQFETITFEKSRERHPP